MITKPTTLILGAGSSVHCGYPLGQDLINQLCTRRTKKEDEELAASAAEICTPEQIRDFISP